MARYENTNIGYVSNHKLVNNYNIAINSYEKFGGLAKQGSGASKRVMKNIFKRRQTD